MKRWTTDWPTTPGWYWSCVEGATNPRTGGRDTQPVEVCIAGGKPKTFVIYLRGGHFFYESEHPAKSVWWLPLDVPEFEPEAVKQGKA